MQKRITEIYNLKSNAVSNIASKLEELNPLSVLARGYSIAEKDGKVISSKTQLEKDDEFMLEFLDGKIKSKVTGE